MNITNRIDYKIRYKSKLILLIIGIIIVLSSCATHVELAKNQSLLSSNKINLINYKGSRTSKFDLKDELSTLYKQKPNRNWLIFIDRERVYTFLEINKNKKVRARKTLTKIAEPPAINDTSFIRLTKNNMYNYMFNKGFFNVNVSHQSKRNTSKNKSKLTYIVSAGKKYSIDSLIYLADDSEILKILEEHRKDAILRNGIAVDNLIFQAEKSRIAELLRNHGYAEFVPVYVQNMEVDTLGNTTIVRIKINNPDKNMQHKKYVVGRIDIHSNYNPTKSEPETLSQYDSLNFYNSSSPYFIKNEVLADRIILEPGRIYRKSTIDSSFNRLSNLEYYKFINIDSKIDSNNTSQIIHTINLTPQYKWLSDFGADINYSSLPASSSSTAITSLMGISTYALLKNRNIYHRGYSFETKIEAGAELNLFNQGDNFKFSKLFNTLNINFANSLQLPSFYDITGIFSLYKNIAKPWNLKFNKPYTKTNINLGVEYVRLANLFSYTSFNNNISYNIPISKNRNFNISTIDLSVYVPNIEKAFDTILKTNPFLEKSFATNRIFTSVFLSRLQYVSKKKLNNRWSKNYIASFETSGIEASIIDGISHLINNKKITDIKVRDTLALLFSKFIKIESDHRWNYTLNNKSELAFRLNYGIAVPFQKTSPVPYIRQFFMGGPQSMRGWRLRELGPGGDTSSIHANLGNYYSSGDIKFEMNAEYRFPIFWYFEGALFTDLGNLWLLPNSQITKKEGEISTQFYKQIAIASGLGIRLNVNYFLLRLDYGIKLRNPYLNEKGNYGIYTKQKWDPERIYNNSSFQLALNYPF